MYYHTCICVHGKNHGRIGEGSGGLQPNSCCWTVMSGRNFLDLGLSVPICMVKDNFHRNYPITTKPPRSHLETCHHENSRSCVKRADVSKARGAPPSGEGCRVFQPLSGWSYRKLKGVSLTAHNFASDTFIDTVSRTVFEMERGKR